MTGSSVRVVGGLLPPDVLAAVAAGGLDGVTGSAYHLGGEAPQAAAARAWAHLKAVWQTFRQTVDRLPEGDPAVGVTREQWLGVLLTDLGYGRVPLTPAGGLVIDGTAYPVSHLWGSTPMHLLGRGVDLDRRNPGVTGAARAPHAMLQEALNRTDDHLWAVLSNGRVLRLLRDSTSLTGQAYVEFDLESMFDADQFADFVTLFLLCHQSRVEVPAGGVPGDCWLERWRLTAVSQGVRALGLLREGVQQALEVLGTGFLQHPANTDLRAGLDDGAVTLEDVHRNLLRLAYRLLFWSVAEDRGALLDPDATPQQRQRYADYYSSARLRRTALRRHGSAHDDLWQGVDLVLGALSRVDGEPRLGLPGLGGLFTRDAAEVLAGCRVSNSALLAAVRHLSVVQPKGQPRRKVDFAHLGAEELGSIYESLLELVPRREPVSQTFSLQVLAGNDRKSTGSYYTPTSLVDLVLDTALDPVLDAAEKTAHERGLKVEDALLAVRVCDPAIGSGHFMVAAARRIAARVAAARTAEVDPTPTSLSEAMHEVVARCIYGVDVNPMAADLAKVSLWLEAMTPGKPLSFLDHHIKVGNALLGATPALLIDGIPDTAYKPLTGDDKKTAASWRKNNAGQRAGQKVGGGQPMLGMDDEYSVDNAPQRALTAEVDSRAAGATSLADTAWAAQRYATGQRDPQIIRARRLADAWCAAFLTPKTPGDPPITHDTLNAVHDGTAGADVLNAVDRLAARHRLFHWHLEFPDIFTVPEGGANTPTGWTGGFDATLGNPPWETLQISEKEFFDSRAPEIVAAPNASARKKAIAALTESRPSLHAEFSAEARRNEVENQLVRGGRFPLCATGKINTYSVFAEHFRTCLAPTGRSGIITPTGLATDATTAAFFADTLKTARLAAFYDFENEAKIFDNVHHAFRFAVTSMTGGEQILEVRLAFLTRHVEDVPTRRFALGADEVLLLNPNTGTLPVFRTRCDAEITLACYRRHPVLIRDSQPTVNPWGLRFSQGLFNMASDSGEFRTADDLASIAPGARFDGWAYVDSDDRWLPLYEAKMLNHWNYRYSTYRDATQAQLNMQTLPRLTDGQLDDPTLEALPRYWVAEKTVDEAVPHGWDRGWFLGWRDIARASDARTLVPSVLPKAAVGHKFPIATMPYPRRVPLLQAVWSSLAFDYISRQKLSGTGMTYFIVKQLACPTPEAFTETPAWSATDLEAFVRPRVLELTYTSHRIQPYAVDVIGGDPGAPFRWVPERRDQLKAELDAAMFHLYGLDRADTEHVLDSFFVIRKYEERDHGEFRTKRLVLAAYDAMTDAATSGRPFTSPLHPAPGHGPRHPA